MKFFIDFEFIEDGKTIDPISVGIVREDGVEYYAEFAECDLSRASFWVRQNVMPHLTGETKARAKIAWEIIQFVGFETPEFWGYYADYDWVALCQLYGPMVHLPHWWPHYCLDLRQYSWHLKSRGIDHGFNKQPRLVEHNALADAKWNLSAWQEMRALDGAQP